MYYLRDELPETLIERAKGLGTLYLLLEWSYSKVLRRDIWVDFMFTYTAEWVAMLLCFGLLIVFMFCSLWPCPNTVFMELCFDK